MDVLSIPNSVWIALATLLKEKPDRGAFFAREIIEKIKELKIQGDAKDTTIKTHVSTHCVANKPPHPDTHRKIVRLSQGMYRLYIDGDYYDKRRENGQTVPLPDMIPKRFHHLIDWYYNDYVKSKLARVTPSGKSIVPTSDIKQSTETYDEKSIEFAMIDSNNSIHIPDKIMKIFNLKSGDHLGFILSDDKLILKKAKIRLEV